MLGEKDQFMASSVLKNIQRIQSQVYSMYVPLIYPCCLGSFFKNPIAKHKCVHFDLLSAISACRSWGHSCFSVNLSRAETCERKRGCKRHSFQKSTTSVTFQPPLLLSLLPANKYPVTPACSLLHFFPSQSFQGPPLFPSGQGECGSLTGAFLLEVWAFSSLGPPGFPQGAFAPTVSNSLFISSKISHS